MQWCRLFVCAPGPSPSHWLCWLEFLLRLLWLCHVSLLSLIMTLLFHFKVHFVYHFTDAELHV